MKFAHLADCHIGGWREPKMRDLSINAFTKAIDMCIKENVDFILIAGDLFNTSLPSIDHLKEAVDKLKEVKDNNIPTYIIAGSHDYSPSGKTMLDVLEKAGLFINVVKGQAVENKLKLNFTMDPKTGVKITGMLGKKGMLDKHFYESLEKESLEQEAGFKIFMFHTLLTELKPKEFEKMDSAPLSFLPKNFNYYAGGHPHFTLHKSEDNYQNICYPGPLFPNNFRELEALGRGGFFIFEDNNIKFQPVKVINTESMKIDCNNLSAEQIVEKVKSEIKDKEYINTVVTLRFFGKIKSGKISDIDFREIIKLIYDKSAFFVMKSSTKLTTPEYEEIKLDINSVDDIEDSLVREHIGQSELYDKEDEKDMIKELLNTLNIPKMEGEKNQDFESRVRETASKILLDGSK